MHVRKRFLIISLMKSVFVCYRSNQEVDQCSSMRIVSTLNYVFEIVYRHAKQINRSVISTTLSVNVTTIHPCINIVCMYVCMYLKFISRHMSQSDSFARRVQQAMNESDERNMSLTVF